MHLAAQSSCCCWSFVSSGGLDCLACCPNDLDMVRRSCNQVLCLNRRLGCSRSPDHALSRVASERSFYGPNMVPYRHHHEAQRGSLHCGN